jgi:hypothetical protein
MPVKLTWLIKMCLNEDSIKYEKSDTCPIQDCLKQGDDPFITVLITYFLYNMSLVWSKSGGTGMLEWNTFDLNLHREPPKSSFWPVIIMLIY